MVRMKWKVQEFADMLAWIDHSLDTKCNLDIDGLVDMKVLHEHVMKKWSKGVNRDRIRDKLRQHVRLQTMLGKGSASIEDKLNEEVKDALSCARADLNSINSSIQSDGKNVTRINRKNQKHPEDLSRQLPTTGRFQQQMGSFPEMTPGRVSRNLRNKQRAYVVVQKPSVRRAEQQQHATSSEDMQVRKQKRAKLQTKIINRTHLDREDSIETIAPTPSPLTPGMDDDGGDMISYALSSHRNASRRKNLDSQLQDYRGLNNDLAQKIIEEIQGLGEKLGHTQTIVQRHGNETAHLSAQFAQYRDSEITKEKRDKDKRYIANLKRELNSFYDKISLGRDGGINFPNYPSVNAIEKEWRDIRTQVDQSLLCIGMHQTLQLLSTQTEPESGSKLDGLVRRLVGLTDGTSHSWNRLLQIAENAPKPVLAALLHAAIYEWVFQSAFPSIPEYESPILDEYRQLVLKAGSLDKLRMIDAAAYKRVFQSSRFLDEIIPAEAKTLAGEFSDMIATILPTVAPSETNCIRKQTTEIFGEWLTRALRLKIELLISSRRYAMLFPQPGDRFDSNTMTMTPPPRGQSLPRLTDISTEVVLCLSPCIIMFETDPSPEASDSDIEQELNKQGVLVSSRRFHLFESDNARNDRVVIANAEVMVKSRAGGRIKDLMDKISVLS